MVVPFSRSKGSDFRKMGSSTATASTDSDSGSTRSIANDESSSNRSKYEEMTLDNLTMLLHLRGMDVSGIKHDRNRCIEEAIKGDGTCYDEAAKEVMAYVNSSKANRKNNKPLDAIWQDKKTGSKVYIGNAVAAANKRALKRKNIFAIVNCQGLASENYHESNKKFYYHRFPVTDLSLNKQHQFDPATGAGVYKGGFMQTFQFMHHHLSQGRSVLVHCTAGAHRAGTVGVAWMMQQQPGLGALEGIEKVKKVRPIVQPFGLLLGLLNFLEKDLALGGGREEKTAVTKRQSVAFKRQQTEPVSRMTMREEEQSMYADPCLSA
mmetsp:Transcript_42231/g.62540  ORF Transcript_42231/g.62540 Transcript_42231/m.62540 type:complete len:321 (-) Transcript_42231:230-1192(-)|eukprot:CAMPEP_0194049194 /NCGR_PEP_ID=MMETSP0009_2-20130614/29974_1 /TAXON_ID=210454 /ORGANISM="Grammatophora oceanica, Strain CCMP 410" /LENGTH=320 /DNA_ID=CAMNT_0038695287 /DNA_START=179 /DNA_END=1141 /DNA_ORIENTATION=-